MEANMILKRSLWAGSDPELEFIHLLQSQYVDSFLRVPRPSNLFFLLIIAPGLVLPLRRGRLVSLKSVLRCRNLRSQTTEAPSQGITSAVDWVQLCKSKRERARTRAHLWRQEQVSMLNTYRASCWFSHVVTFQWLSVTNVWICPVAVELCVAARWLCLPVNGQNKKH